MGDKYKSLLLKIGNGSESMSYYQADDFESSEYHLNLIELNSFLSSLQSNYKKELLNIRKEIKSN